MSWGVTPGVAFLARHVAGPTALHYALLTVASRLIESRAPALPHFPAWALLSVSFLVIPTRIFAHIAYTRWNNQREAERRGARLAPALIGKKFGNRDQLEYLLNCWKYGYICDGLREMTEDLGPAFSPDLLFGSVVFTVWPEHVKIILSTDFANYVKGLYHDVPPSLQDTHFHSGERFQYAMSAVLGSGVFNSDGDIWKFHRSMTRPFFSRERVTDLDRFERHTQTALSLLVEKAKTGYAMDIQDVMQRLALDVSTDILFGSCANTLEISAEDLALPYNHPQYSAASAKPANRATAFSDAFLNAQFVIADRERHGHIWPLLEIFEDRAKPHMEVVNRYVDPIIQEALRKNADNPKSGDSNEIEADETLLDHLVRSTSDHKLLRDETLNILLAGRDTSSAVLTFTIYFLSLHPEVMKKLREEILDQVGPSRAPTYDDVRAMKYLRAVINESMRLLPPVPNDVRECVNGGIWPSPDPNEKPIYIPPGTSTPYSPVLVHTRKDLWGPDADEFDPDRFIDDRVKKYLVPNPFIFIPFNAGPRICLGQQFAYNLMSFVLVRLLQQFSSFSLDEEALTPEMRVPKEWAETGKNSRKAKERFRPHTVLTMSSKGGIWIRPTLADG